MGALYFRCRRVLSKAQLGGVQNPDPHAQTGLRIIRAHMPLHRSVEGSALYMLRALTMMLRALSIMLRAVAIAPS